MEPLPSISPPPPTISNSTDLPQSSKENSSPQIISDVGEIYVNAKSPVDFTTAMQSLTPTQKYDLLTKHKVSHKDHVFLTQYLGGCNRSFQLTWLSEHPWMIFSEKVDGIFCIVCAIFCSECSKGYFVNKPFHVWNKKVRRLRSMPTHCIIRSVWN